MRYTRADIGFILANKDNLTDIEFAKIFGVTLKAFQQKRRKLGIYSKENKGRFKKGHKPSPKAKPKGPNRTSFKKGNEPHNTRKDGDISIRKDNCGRPYKYMRIAKGKWVLLHHHIYQNEIGAIPPGHVVVFKDGDSLNCNIDNLECISLKENLYRNRNRKKAAQSMRNRWRQAKMLRKMGINKSWYKNERHTQ